MKPGLVGIEEGGRQRAILSQGSLVRGSKVFSEIFKLAAEYLSLSN